MASSGIFHTISGEDLDVIMDLIDEQPEEDFMGDDKEKEVSKHIFPCIYI